MPATLADVGARFRQWLGYIEGPPPGHSGNDTIFGRWYGINPGAWCAMFVSWCFFDAGLPLPASTSKGFAWCPSGAEFFMRRGRWGTTPRPGAVIFFRFGERIDHVGWVEFVENGVPHTIEGNTSPGPGGSQNNGGGVWRRTRTENIAGYGYPDYSTSAPEVPDMPLSAEDLAKIGGVIDARLEAKFEWNQGGVWVLSNTTPVSLPALGGVYRLGSPTSAQVETAWIFEDGSVGEKTVSEVGTRHVDLTPPPAAYFLRIRRLSGGTVGVGLINKAITE